MFAHYVLFSGPPETILTHRIVRYVHAGMDIFCRYTLITYCIVVRRSKFKYALSKNICIQGRQLHKHSTRYEIHKVTGTQYKYPTMWCNLNIQEVHLKKCNSV
jgi:hypothetical protein